MTPFYRFFKSIFHNASESLRLILSNDVTRDYGNSKQGTDADGNNKYGKIVAKKSNINSIFQSRLGSHAGHRRARPLLLENAAGSKVGLG